MSTTSDNVMMEVKPKPYNGTSCTLSLVLSLRVPCEVNMYNGSAVTFSVNCEANKMHC